MVIMCIESAATAALSVWEQWVQTAPPLLSRAAVYCVHTLTAYEPYASLADACVRAYFSSPECPGWSSIAVLWRGGHWRDASPLCARARLHAAYVTLAAHDHAPSAIRAALLALLAAEVDL
ncbi:uncharacterized protein LOC135076583 [Ostrinia nubilalis]|uniref:uncharacterized protein LOC135076583 n=1 Tax=Ostrinia nubilalis TaxID=29057 RepID=UPI0030824276